MHCVCYITNKLYTTAVFQMTLDRWYSCVNTDGSIRPKSISSGTTSDGSKGSWCIGTSIYDKYCTNNDIDMSNQNIGKINANSDNKDIERSNQKIYNWMLITTKQTMRGQINAKSNHMILNSLTSI